MYEAGQFQKIVVAKTETEFGTSNNNQNTENPTITVNLTGENIATAEVGTVTNGKAIPITCTKNSRSEKTVYEDLEGNEIKVNDGRTFINICPIDAEVVIEGGETQDE